MISIQKVVKFIDIVELAKTATLFDKIITTKEVWIYLV